VTEANYADLNDAAVMHLAGLIKLEADASFTGAFPARQGARVEIETTDGKVLTATLPDVVPATEAEIRVRFRASAAETVGAARTTEIEHMIDSLESVPSVGALPRLARNAIR
jgi:2-methylcitrate dehydratase PrpD